MDNEQHKRQINANALALDALAAFARYRTSLPLDLTSEERIQLLEKWAKPAVTVVGEAIDELQAYERTEMQYSGPVQEFIVNMGSMSFLEVLNVLPKSVLIRLLADTCTPDILAAALRLCKERNKYPDLPENPEDN